MGLTKVAIERPVFILMLMLLCVFGGVRAFNGMRKEQNPDVQFGTATITTVYPGAGPEEMNTLVSRKIEEAVAGLNNILEVTSTSQEGVSVVVCNFQIGTNMDVALSDIRSKIDAVTGELPRDAEKPIVEKFDFTAQPVLTMALNSETLNGQELRDLVDQKIKDRFSQIPGVSSVAVFGGDIREIQVQVKKDKLLAYGIGISDVQRAVAGASLNVPSGRITAKQTETAVRVLGEFKSTKEIEDLTITVSDPNRQGAKPALVRLGDVATVQDTVAERRVYSRLDGKDAITLSIQKAKEGNAIEITSAARALVPVLAKEYNVNFVETFSSGDRIVESLDDLTLTLYIGIALVAFIVYLFLHNFRGTLIVAIAIPVCLLATIMVYQVLGFTINNLSMLALSLAIGVLVDDAIVVLENIYRHLKMGEDPVEAAINGRSEIGLAAIAITMADVVVFLPVGFMGGVVGQFFRPLGIGFAVAVMLSLFVSFTVTPMLAARWYRKGEDAEAMGGGFAHRFEGWFVKLENRYRNSLEWSLNHRWFVFSAGWVALIGIGMFLGGSSAQNVAGAIKVGMGGAQMAIIVGVIAFVVSIFRRNVAPRILLGGVGFGFVLVLFAVAGFGYASWKRDQLFRFQFFPESDGGQVSITIQLAPGANLAETQRVVERVESIVRKNPDTKYTVSRIGSKGSGFSAADQGTNYAQVDVTLNDKTALLERLEFWKHDNKPTRTKPDTSVSADILASIGRIAGAKIAVATSGGQGFGSAIQMSFRSDDRAKLTAAVKNIADKLAGGAVDGVINVELSSKPGKPELQAIPDRTLLADAGQTVASVGSAMRVLYSGNVDAKYRVLGQEYDIRVMMDLNDRNNPEIVSQVPVAFNQGNPIFLSSVTNLRDATAPDKVERRDRQEEIRITADLLPGKAAGTVQAQINKWLVDENLLPAGVQKKDLGQADVQARESGYLFSALGIGFLLVYALLASLYDNLLYPFIIQLAQPQAMVGALLALILTDKSLNIVGFIGLIALVGLVGKNAILLVDYTNTLRERGLNRHDAIVQAGPVRLRPIAMTTSAVLLGMLPVALAIGRGSEFRETIGIIIIGGITLSTLLTLLIIPCSYTIFDDFSNWIGGMRRGNKQKA